MPHGIRFARQGVRILTTLATYKGKTYLRVFTEVPEGKTVQLKDIAIQVLWDGHNQDKAAFRKTSVLIDERFIYNPTLQEQIINAHEPMVGKRMPGGWDKSYALAAYINIPDADEFRVILPQLTVNEELVTLPELRFQKKWRMTLINLIGVLHC